MAKSFSKVGHDAAVIDNLQRLLQKNKLGILYSHQNDMNYP